MTSVFSDLTRTAGRLAALALAALAGFLAVPGEARALLVPGSVAGGFVIDTVFYAVDDVTGLAQNGGGFNVSGAGYQIASISPQAGSQFDGFNAGGAGTKWGLSATFDYRHLDLDAGGLDLDYDIFVGTLALGYAVDDRLTVIGGGLAEYGFGNSDFNVGTIYGVGFGMFGGAVYSIDRNWTLSGFAGYQRVNFDVTRAAGTIEGNFDANRYFAAAEADYRDQGGPWVWRLGGGLRYIYQDSNSYLESGPGAVFVPSIREEVLSLTSRAKLGYMIGDGITPFGEVDFRYDVSENTSTAVGVATLSQSLSDWSLRTLVGTEWAGSDNVRLLAQGGPTFSGDGYDGFELRLNAQIRF